VVSKDGTVYTYTASGKICAYDKQGGKQWEYNAQLDWPDYYDKMMVWLSIGADGTIYILPWNYCTEQNENITHVSILALTPKGTQKWCIDFPPLYPNEGSFPAVAPDGSIYIVLCKSGNDEGALYKISSNGKFEEIISGDFYNSALAPLVDSAGTIYITNYLDLGHEIIAVSLDGSQKWTLDLRPFINSYFNSINLIEMGKDGAIYILTENDLLAIGPAGIGLEVRVPIDARMYVKSIDMQSVMEGSQVSIYTKVTIVDANGEPVPRAAVSLATKPVGWGSLYQFGLTRVDGTVTFIYPPENFEGRYGAWVATVTDVEKQGWEYDRAQNVETSETCEIHCS